VRYQPEEKGLTIAPPGSKRLRGPAGDFSALPQNNSNKRLSIPAFGIVAANLLITCALWNTLGWFDLRGYREVINYFIYIPISLIALANILLGMIFWLSRPPPRDAPTTAPPPSGEGHTAAPYFFWCAVAVASTIVLGPTVGPVLNRLLILPTPLYEASRYGDARVVIAKIKRGADPNAYHPVLGTTLLHDMAAHGETEAVKLLLQKGANPNLRRGFNSQTPLHIAVQQRVDVEIIRMLLNHGADARIRDDNGHTAPYVASLTPGYEGERVFAEFGYLIPRDIGTAVPAPLRSPTSTRSGGSLGTQ
jgi:hypothetical protein